MTIIEPAIATISLIGISLLLIPEATYYDILKERLYFKNVMPLIYIIMSNSLFLIGVYLSYKIKGIMSRRLNFRSGLDGKLILATGLLVIILNLLYIFILLRITGGIEGALSGAYRQLIWQSAGEMKIGFIPSLTVALVSITSFGIFLQSSRNYLIGSIYIASILSCISISILSGTRAGIFQLIAVFFLILYLKYKTGRIQKHKMVIVGLLSLTLLPAGFLLSTADRIISFNGSRSADLSQIIYYSGLGYLYSGLNKFAYIYSGGKIFDDLSSWNLFAPLYNLPLVGSSYASVLSDYGINVLLASSEDWSDSFNVVENAGFNRGFNVLSIYGEMYGSFGWLSLPLMVTYGYLSGIIFRSYNRGGYLGIIMAPYILFSFMQWLVYNPFFSRDFMISLITVGLIYTYQVLSVGREKNGKS
nr:O-antigen polymerase [Deinococcus sp. 14RED07]